MDDLISRIVASTGIDSSLAQKAVGILLNMFMKQGDQGVVGKLMDAMPGAGDLATMAAASASGGGVGAAVKTLLKGGGVMGAGAALLGGKMGGTLGTVAQLAGAGLSMNQAKGVGNELISYAKEKGGEELVAQLAKSVPGLSKFL